MKEKSTHNYPSSPFGPPPPPLKQKLEENMKMQVSFSSNFWLPDQTLKTLNKEYAWKWDFNHIFPIRVD